MRQWILKKEAEFIASVKAPFQRLIRSVTIWWWEKMPPKPTPEVMDRYFSFQMTETAARILAGIFYSPATKEQKFITGNPKQVNWAAFDAARFLIECDHITIFAVFRCWFENPERFEGPSPPPANVKPGIIVGLWLTNPSFADHAEKIGKLVNMIAHPAMNSMLEAMLGGWSPEAIAVFLERVPEPGLGGLKNVLEKALPKAKAVPVFMMLKQRNPERFGSLSRQLPPEYSGEVVKEVVIKETAKKEGERKEKEWVRTEKRMDIESTISDILDLFKRRMIETYPEKKIIESGSDTQAPEEIEASAESGS